MPAVDGVRCADVERDTAGEPDAVCGAVPEREPDGVTVPEPERDSEAAPEALRAPERETVPVGDLTGDAVMSSDGEEQAEAVRLLGGERVAETEKDEEPDREGDADDVRAADEV